MTSAKITALTPHDVADGLENLIAQLGTAEDKRHHSRFVNNKNLSAVGNQEELHALYRTDWLSGKVVDIVPDDMCREWRSFTSEDLDPDVLAMIQDETEALDLVGKFNQAHKWARLFGTAYIVMSVDDGQTPDKPIDFDKIKLGGLRHMHVIDRHRCSNYDVTPIADPLDARFGLPEFYRFNDTSVKIHHSRMLRFDGVKIPFDEFRRNNYNNDSVLSRLYDSITNFNTTANASASMVYETNVDIVQVKNLMQYLQSSEGEALVRKRFGLASTMKSINNMLLIDTDENFQTKTNNFSGLPELLDRFASFLSAASDIPATRLLGASANGLNATGEGDLKNYYDMIRSQQTKVYGPLLKTIDAIIAKSLGLSDDVDLKFEFNPLFQMTPTEKSQKEYNDAQRDAIYLDRDVITECQVAKQLKELSTYTNIDDDHLNFLEGVEHDNIEPDPAGSEFEAQTTTEESK